MLEFMSHPITLTMIACSVTISLYYLYMHVYENAFKLGRSIGRKEILEENIVRANKSAEYEQSHVESLMCLFPNNNV